MDWLFLPIDPTRVHDINEAVAWHGRLMMIAWGVSVPVGVLAARFFKILPWQDWPRALDSKLWWNTHLVMQYLAALLTLGGIVLVVRGPAAIGSVGAHAVLGWSIVVLACGQVLGGWLRGSKGGPTEPQPDGSFHGDHYSMTPRRLVFEVVHKSGGYLALLVAAGAIVSGLWRVNAPNWMWLSLAVWWLALGAIAAMLQHNGRAFDTYQAIWGPGANHPGNARRPIGIGIIRPGD